MRRVVRSGDYKWDQAVAIREAKSPAWQKRLEKAMIYAKGDPLNFSREERLEIARMIPGVNQELESWKDLSQAELDSLLNFLEGFIYISYMLAQRQDYDSLEGE